MSRARRNSASSWRIHPVEQPAAFTDPGRPLDWEAVADAAELTALVLLLATTPEGGIDVGLARTLLDELGHRYRGRRARRRSGRSVRTIPVGQLAPIVAQASTHALELADLDGPGPHQ